MLYYFFKTQKDQSWNLKRNKRIAFCDVNCVKTVKIKHNATWDQRRNESHDSWHQKAEQKLIVWDQSLIRWKYVSLHLSSAAARYEQDIQHGNKNSTIGWYGRKNTFGCHDLLFLWSIAKNSKPETRDSRSRVMTLRQVIFGLVYFRFLV